MELVSESFGLSVVLYNAPVVVFGTLSEVLCGVDVVSKNALPAAMGELGVAADVVSGNNDDAASSLDSETAVEKSQVEERTNI